MNATTEALNNIKMLKLYSWIQTFSKRIEIKRNSELKTLSERMIIASISITSLYFFPQMLTFTLFAVYIGAGNNLSLSTAFAVQTVLNILREPLRWAPNLVGFFIEFQVSMRRIQTFLDC
mmetsp:Transcript_33930/g.33059  ORF Transcript_33930/g.33059 Transcript_33930/m.33059 type:complete len:120 (+) Transcript_33930:886-1245(+)